MKVLIITRSYLDENLGGPNCSKAFVNAVGALYDDCTLVYPEHNDRKTDLSFLTNKRICLVPCRDYRTKWQKGLDMYRGRLHRFGSFVKQYLSSHPFDVIFIDHSIVASSGVLAAAKKTGGKIVTLHHNVEKDYILDNQQSILFRFPYNYFSLKAERQAILQSDVNLTLTQSDCNFFKSEYPQQADSFDVLGMFEKTEQERVPISEATDSTFVISGSLQAQQTETAIMSFLTDYLQIISRAEPAARVIITGRNPSQTLLAECRQHSNVTVIPSPKDIESVIRTGTYYIAPIHTGSGLKLRVMDALRLGLPVISHKVSARGYESIADDGFMNVYDDPTTFATALNKMLKSKIVHKDVADSYYRHFAFTSGVRRLHDALNKVIQK